VHARIRDATHGQALVPQFSLVDRFVKSWRSSQCLAFRIALRFVSVFLSQRLVLLPSMRPLNFVSQALLAASLTSAIATVTPSPLPQVDLGYEIHQAISFNVCGSLGST
jgi:hypothetical protein